MAHELQPRQVNGGEVCVTYGDGYRLSLDQLDKPTYALAQIDDYMDLPRYKFPHTQGMTLNLEARLSTQSVLGTWGFGLWNDPFGVGIGGGGRSRLLPVLPNAAWFFYGSNQNYLTLREDQPANGFHAKTFRSPLLPSLTTFLTIPFLPLAIWRTARQYIRQFVRVFVKEDGMNLDIDVETWHVYQLLWNESQVSFLVDNDPVFLTNIIPKGRLGIVVWIDNQFFRFDGSGKLDFGYLKVIEPQWMEVRSISIEKSEIDINKT
jgi:hypothetical protein